MARFTTSQVLGTGTLLLALAGTAVVAAPADVVWVDNDSFALSGCARSDELPGSEDPQVLMRQLRERGLADAVVRLNGRFATHSTLTPISASLRCDGVPSSAVFRLSTVERNGQVSTSNLVSRLPAPSTPVASSR
ncbi:MAG TPA: hypothetical protein VFU71_14810 [Burkholderiaceae bacterium]|nr:hypothetical protein [Burkholderiaceae bacterium]